MQLTDPGPVDAQVTTETLKDALHGMGELLHCAVPSGRTGTTSQALRGRVLCADQATGKVAFVPLPGNTNPFESEDCAAALPDRMSHVLWRREVGVANAANRKMCEDPAGVLFNKL